MESDPRQMPRLRWVGVVPSSCRCRFRIARRFQVLQGPNTRGKSEQADEARGITLFIHVVLAKRNEALVVQRVLACPTGDGNRSATKPQRN